MRRNPDWPTVRAELEARGFALDAGGLFGPPDAEEAWLDWERLEPLLQPSGPAVQWGAVEHHLDQIEAALGKRVDLRSESWTVRHPKAPATVKTAVRELAKGACEANDVDEALHRLSLASRAASQVGSGPTLISVLLSVSASRYVYEAAGTLTERNLPPEANARVREIIAPLTLRPWRELVLGELRFGLGYLDYLVSSGDGMVALALEEREMARILTRPGALDRAKAMLAALYGRGLDVPPQEDDLGALDRVAPLMEPSKLGRFSPDALTRMMAKSSGGWLHLPRLYRSMTSYRRMIRFASLAADLPAGSRFSAVERLRLELGAEGWDPFLRNPLRADDEGNAWAFFASDVRGAAVVRIRRL